MQEVEISVKKNSVTAYSSNSFIKGYYCCSESIFNTLSLIVSIFALFTFITFQKNEKKRWNRSFYERFQRSSMLNTFQMTKDIPQENKNKITNR